MAITVTIAVADSAGGSDGRSVRVEVSGGGDLDLYSALPEPLPGGRTSWWLDHYDRPTWDAAALWPSGQPGVTAGCRPGTARSAAQAAILPAGTYVDLAFTGQVKVAAEGVILINCSLDAAGAQSALQVDGALMHGPTLIDCELTGGAACTLMGGGYLVGCYLADGVDVINWRGDTPVALAHSVLDGPVRSGASHSDCLQSSTNPPSTTVHHLRAWRSMLSCTDRHDGTNGNRVTQLGAYGSDQSGIEGWIRECYIVGGTTYAVSWHSPAGDLEVTDCQFRRGSISQLSSVWYGGNAPPVSGGCVWDDDLSPVS